MLERDLEALKNLVAEVRLDGLENGIWRRLTADQELTRMRRLILGCQAGVVAVFIIASAVGGVALRGNPPPPGLDAFSVNGMPTPSTLLLGNHI